MPYQTFAVEITTLPSTPETPRCRVRVTAPVGEASADLNMPFTQAEIDNYLAILGGSAPNITRAQKTATARELGERLFNFVLRASDDVQAAFVASLERAGNNGLRIRLSVDGAGILSTLPWELLRDSAYGREYLALSRATPIVRYPAQITLRQPLALTLPLRVLVVLSAPANFPTLDVEGEWQRLLDATAPLRANGTLELVRLEHATLIDLQRELRQREYHIFHYIGHSDFDSATKQGVLVFESEGDEAQAQIITGRALGRELAEENTIRLTVINSCHSARRPDQDALAGISSGLVARGIPAVIAMQFAISDGAAKIFAEELYRAITEGFPIDTAVSEARRAIANRQFESMEWATPVLYLRADDGVLFNTTATPIADTAAPPIQPPNPLPRIGAFMVIIVMLLALTVVLVPVLFPPVPTSTPTNPPTTGITTPTVPPGQAELEITGDARFFPRRPVPGETFRVSLTVTNTGTVDSGSFNIQWDASVSAPIMENRYSTRADNIPPGTSKNITFAYSYGWWGEYSTLFQIDVNAEVSEANESNNRRFFPITMQDVPFALDFSILPNNELVQPPFILADETFLDWSLRFNVLGDDCAAAPLQLIENSVDEADILLTAGNDVAACTNQPLSITTTRGPVSNAMLELVAALPTTYTLTYYGDEAGTQTLFTLQNINLAAGETRAVTPNAGQPLLIRRVDIDGNSQPVQLTGMSLTRPPQ